MPWLLICYLKQLNMSNFFLYFNPFLLAFILSFVLTMGIILFWNKYISRIKPDVSRFGGAAIIISFLAAIFLSGNLALDNLKWGIIVSSLIILFFGIYDDLKNLSWKKQLLGQLLIVIIMIYAGLQVDYIANPFGGAEFRLDSFQFLCLRQTSLGLALSSFQFSAHCLFYSGSLAL